jgi:hypothetical protein
VAASGSAPVLGVICDAGTEDEVSGVGRAVTNTLSTAPRWAASVDFRWLNSNRDFIGDRDNNAARDLAQNWRQNRLATFDLSLVYQLTPRWTLSVSAPVEHGTRINWAGLTAPHLETHSFGIGDTSIGASVWLLRPPPENHFNIQVGFALKLPTGNDDVTYNHTVTGAPIPATAVDQSIQLGDGGWGFSLSYAMYKSIRRLTLFSSGKYLFNPMDTNGVKTGRGSPLEAIMSVPDQYLWQGGLGYAIPRMRGLAMTVASRMDGVPAHDLIGKSDGFRRPGYAVSLGPGIQYMHGKDMWSFNYDFAVRRDRTRSTSDIISGTHGDAFFADSVIYAGYTRSF